MVLIYSAEKHTSTWKSWDSDKKQQFKTRSWLTFCVSTYNNAIQISSIVFHLNQTASTAAAAALHAAARQLFTSVHAVSRVLSSIQTTTGGGYCIAAKLGAPCNCIVIFLHVSLVGGTNVTNSYIFNKSEIILLKFSKLYYFLRRVSWDQCYGAGLFLTGSGYFYHRLQLLQKILKIQFFFFQHTGTYFFHADPDPDPGSQKCPYGSRSKEVNT